MQGLAGRRVTSVSLGDHHSACVTSDGELFTWGWGKHGLLGHGDETNVREPRPVSALAGTRVASVKCGWSHTLALTADGEVLAWGWNLNGQLGVGSIPEPPSAPAGSTPERAAQQQQQQWVSSPVPVRVEGLEGVRVSQISAGSYHCALVTGDGKVMTWGWGKGGRLGHGDNVSQSIPTVVQALVEANVRVVSVSCGDAHTVVVASDGAVYGWGDSSCGQLGPRLGPDRSPALPVRLADPVPRGAALPIALAGGTFTVIAPGAGSAPPRSATPVQQGSSPRRSSSSSQQQQQHQQQQIQYPPPLPLPAAAAASSSSPRSSPRAPEHAAVAPVGDPRGDRAFYERELRALEARLGAAPAELERRLAEAEAVRAQAIAETQAFRSILRKHEDKALASQAAHEAELASARSTIDALVREKAEAVERAERALQQQQRLQPLPEVEEVASRLAAKNRSLTSEVEDLRATNEAQKVEISSLRAQLAVKPVDDPARLLVTVNSIFEKRVQALAAALDLPLLQPAPTPSKVVSAASSSSSASSTSQSLLPVPQQREVEELTEKLLRLGSMSENALVQMQELISAARRRALQPPATPIAQSTPTRGPGTPWGPASAVTLHAPAPQAPAAPAPPAQTPVSVVGVPVAQHQMVVEDLRQANERVQALQDALTLSKRNEEDALAFISLTQKTLQLDESPSKAGSGPDDPREAIAQLRRKFLQGRPGRIIISSSSSSPVVTSVSSSGKENADLRAEVSALRAELNFAVSQRAKAEGRVRSLEEEIKRRPLHAAPASSSTTVISTTPASALVQASAAAPRYVMHTPALTSSSSSAATAAASGGVVLRGDASFELSRALRDLAAAKDQVEALRARLAASEQARHVELGRAQRIIAFQRARLGERSMQYDMPESTDRLAAQLSAHEAAYALDPDVEWGHSAGLEPVAPLRQARNEASYLQHLRTMREGMERSLRDTVKELASLQGSLPPAREDNEAQTVRGLRQRLRRALFERDLLEAELDQMRRFDAAAEGSLATAAGEAPGVRAVYHRRLGAAVSLAKRLHGDLSRALDRATRAEALVAHQADSIRTLTAAASSNSREAIEERDRIYRACRQALEEARDDQRKVQGELAAIFDEAVRQGEDVSRMITVMTSVVGNAEAVQRGAIERMAESLAEDAALTDPRSVVADEIMALQTEVRARSSRGNAEYEGPLRTALRGLRRCEAEVYALAAVVSQRNQAITTLHAKMDRDRDAFEEDLGILRAALNDARRERESLVDHLQRKNDIIQGIV